MPLTTKHAEVTDALTREILEGQYRPGERLPSERDLAARFNANRGAVREAMKQLEQLGLASIQPGGARVRPLATASLDIVGRLLQLKSPPDAALVDQLMLVVHSLVRLAAETTIKDADDSQINVIRESLQLLKTESPDAASHFKNQITVIGSFMRASGNLPLELITNSLLAFLAPALEPFQESMTKDTAADALNIQHLDTALANRDLETLHRTFAAFIDTNRTNMRSMLTRLHNGNTPQRSTAKGHTALPLAGRSS